MTRGNRPEESYAQTAHRSHRAPDSGPPSHPRSGLLDGGETRGPGAFTLQLILDNGAAEYVLRPTAADADLLVKLFARNANATFDGERKVLMFGNLAVK